MPINFNQGNEQGLPNFIGNIMEDQQKQKDRDLQIYLAQQQMANQRALAQPNELDYREDARKQDLSNAQVARIIQGTGLDANADARAQTSLESELGLRSAQTNKVYSDTALDWKKFAVDKDISYKDYDIRKDRHEFDKDSMKTKLGYEIKWGDNQDDREERKFGFEVNKYRQQEAQKEEMKATLAAARKQGTEAVYNTLVDNGMFAEAQTFVNTNEKLEAIQSAKQDKNQAKQQQQVFAQIGPKIMQGKELTDKEAMGLTDAIYGEEFTNKLLGTGQLKEVAKVGALSVFGKNIIDLTGDPLAAAKMASSITGQKVKIPQTPDDIKSLNDGVNGIFSEAERSKKLDMVYTQAIEAAKAWELGGFGSKSFQDAAGDAGDLVGKLSRAVGIPIKSAEDWDRAQEIAAGKVESLKRALAQKKDSNGNLGEENARMLKGLENLDTMGSAGLEAMKEAENLSAAQRKAKTMQDFINENPGASWYDIQSHLFNSEAPEDKKVASTYSKQEIKAELQRRGVIK